MLPPSCTAKNQTNIQNPFKMAKKLYRKSELKMMTGILAYKKRDLQNINYRINQLNQKQSLTKAEFQELNRLRYKRQKHIKTGTPLLFR